ncbi:hypothetical protein HMPREF9069_01476 [Atopobium sp. oral taxon 810 str. F0209]|nr:hypothetical protein HMPREF9069_01476 [Atopobium sp. oral taxon 810 str. F0209]
MAFDTWHEVERGFWQAGRTNMKRNVAFGSQHEMKCGVCHMACHTIGC